MAPIRRPPLERRRNVVAAVVTLAAVLVAPVAAAGAPTGDPRQEQEEVREEKAEAAADLDVLEADQDEVGAALDALDAQLAAQEAKLTEARRASADAAAALEEAEAAERGAARAVAEMQLQVNELAVNAFINPPGGGLAETFESSDLSEAVLKRTFIDVRSARDFDLLDQFERSKNELTSRREAAAAAAVEADEALAAVDAQVAEVAAARDQQAGVVADLNDRLDAKLAEVAALEQLDAELAAQIQAEEEAVARRLAEQREREEQRLREQRASTPDPDPVPEPPTAPVGPPPASGNVNLTTVRGITVASSIADELEAMLAAAEAAGISLSGGGYRDPAGQIAVRKANCGTSYYAIYQMPPSQCSPPTARPGTSMHERGLAIDFTYQGRVISSRSSPAFQWLAGNAASYGLYNLPSEPWHWSTNGN